MTTISAQVVNTPMAFATTKSGHSGSLSSEGRTSTIQAGRSTYGSSVMTNRMAAELKSLSSALANTARGLTMVQSAESGHQTVVGLVKQMRSLSKSMAASTPTTADRTNAQTELSQLRDLVSQTVNKTTQNTQVLLDGTFSRDIQLGTSLQDVLTVTFGSHQPSDFPTSQTLTSLDISSAAGAQTADIVLEEALTYLDGQGIAIRAAGDRLSGTADMLTRSAQLTSAVYDRALSPDGEVAEDKQERARLFDEAASSFLARIRSSSNLLPILLG